MEVREFWNLNQKNNKLQEQMLEIQENLVASKMQNKMFFWSYATDV